MEEVGWTNGVLNHFGPPNYPLIRQTLRPGIYHVYGDITLTFGW